jgi:hypothetical protein
VAISLEKARLLHFTRNDNPYRWIRVISDRTLSEEIKKTLTMEGGTENTLHEAIIAKTGVLLTRLMAERRQ